ncbi:MAG TPA: PBP1A family penicillin-binding protein [Bryobacteraceae bacterium]|nr:PBP1A family penicillin-binding protein [Bryobacteraceae bacterium]
MAKRDPLVKSEGKGGSRRTKAITPFRRYLLYGVTFAGVTALIFGIFTYVHYSNVIDGKLKDGPFPNTSMIFAAPRSLNVGDEISRDEILRTLRNAGYGESKANRMGWYNVRPDAVEILPGPDSYFDNEGGVIRLSEGKIKSIISLRDNTTRNAYSLEPELITHLFDQKREKRRLLSFDDMPKTLVNAIVSVEDKRFFEHVGFDPLRIAKAIYVNVKAGRKEEGASTLSMQLSRNFWLNLEKSWTRKFEESLITIVLEQKLSKQQIFEYYANMIPLGRRGSFAICGVGEASQAYFGKDVRSLTLPEAATLAGLIQRPSYTNPIRWPDRAKARRNVVLSLMRDNGYISDKEYAEATVAPMAVSKAGGETGDAPYFVDLVNDFLHESLADHDFTSRSYRVYTTLDPELQQDAVEAVRIGLAEVDKQLERRKKKNPGGAQVSLIAMDPASGEIRALVGGRNYGLSQLNRAIARRQPGSSFKPFVYAAALNTALTNGGNIFTPTSMMVDEPTTFWFEGKPYEPNNHGDHYFGPVTLRTALAKSLNIPAVKLAEAVGYGEVVKVARAAGMNLQIRPTPALALGAYEMTPIEVAGGYTVFANKGMFSKPNWVRSVRDDAGTEIFASKPTRRQALDPRIAYLVTSMMEEVVRSGTGAGVRSRGFALPAAGKTGTSHDGWFAGFTSKLICVVWIGFDDNEELNLEGSQSALPVWTEFMKRAHGHRAYRGAGPFAMPDGVVAVPIDPANGLLASAGMSNAKTEVFVTGTQPTAVSMAGGGTGTQVASWAAPEETPAPNAPATAENRARQRRPIETQPVEPGEARRNAPPAGPDDKKGVFGRIGDWFKRRNTN